MYEKQKQDKSNEVKVKFADLPKALQDLDKDHWWLKRGPGTAQDLADLSYEDRKKIYDNLNEQDKARFIGVSLMAVRKRMGLLP